MPVSRDTCKKIFQFEQNHPQAATDEISRVLGWAKKTVYNCRSKFDKENLIDNSTVKRTNPISVIEKKKEEYQKKEHNTKLGLSTHSKKNPKKVKLALGDLHLTGQLPCPEGRGL